MAKHGRHSANSQSLRQGLSSSRRLDDASEVASRHARHAGAQARNQVYAQGQSQTRGQSPAQSEPQDNLRSSVNPYSRYSQSVRSRGGGYSRVDSVQGSAYSPVDSSQESTYSQAESAQGSGMYSRDNYGSGATGAHAKHASKKRSRGKKVAIVIAAILGAIIIAGAAYALWFSNALNNALAPSQETRDAVSEQLVTVPLNEPFYMLILGSDSREGSGTSKDPSQQGDQERSDVIMLARIDAPNRQVTLVSIPRDTYYTFEDGRVSKINETFNVGGPALTIKAVSELTGVGISHYASVHISELESIVDYLGGIEVDVDRNLSVRDTLTYKKIEIKKGKQTLNGEQAQAFVRARHEYDREGETMDGGRQSNVRKLTEAIVKKVLNRPIFELPGTILGLAEYVETDLTAMDLVSLGRAFSGGKTTFYSCIGPIDGYIAEEYGGIFLCYPNPEGWAELMRQVDSGAEPQEIDYESTQIMPDSV